MNRIDSRFRKLKERGEKAFIPYICAGDPSLEATADLIVALERAKADVIELGVPFSDPIADGLVNQEAALRSLRNGTSLHDVIGLVRMVRDRVRVPLVLFTYYNPVMAYGIEAFAEDARSAGVDGVLCVDLPPEEALNYQRAVNAEGMRTIFLVAPTSTPRRVLRIAQMSTGFIYYVSRAGVTGVQQTMEANVRPMVERIQEQSPLPVVVGFGISTPEQAADVAAYADGVVVGSAIVRRIAEHGDDPKLADIVGRFAGELSAAVKGRTPEEVRS
jgi:tryptophan synthase alpha chain